MTILTSAYSAFAQPAETPSYEPSNTPEANTFEEGITSSHESGGLPCGNGLIGLAVIIGIVILIARIQSSRRKNIKDFYCSNCGTTAPPETVTKGSIFIEIVLWLFFFLPGFIYSVWRLTSRHKACPSCGATNMIPTDSPKAKKELGID